MPVAGLGRLPGGAGGGATGDREREMAWMP